MYLVISYKNSEARVMSSEDLVRTKKLIQSLIKTKDLFEVYEAKELNPYKLLNGEYNGA